MKKTNTLTLIFFMIVAGLSAQVQTSTSSGRVSKITTDFTTKIVDGQYNRELLGTGWTSGIGDFLFLKHGGNNTESNTYGFRISDSKGFDFGKNNFGTSFLNINTAGNVGIGTISPVARLQIQSNTGQTEALARFQVSDAAGDYLGINNSTGVAGRFAPLIIGHAETFTNSGLSLIGSTKAEKDIVSSMALVTFDARRNNGAIQNRQLFAWQSYGNENRKMTMLANGNLGIGTIAPEQKLHVNGNILSSSANPFMKIEGTGTGNFQGANLILTAKGVSSGNKHVSTWFMNHRNTDGTATIEMQRRGLNSEYNGSVLLYKDGYGWRFGVAQDKTSGLTNPFIIRNNGRVGVGTLTPSFKLHINEPVGGAALGISRGGKTWGLDIENNGQRLFLRHTDNTDVMVIDNRNGGTVGIGTRKYFADYKLSVAGKIQAEEIKVHTGWADYVFKDDYQLPTLEEVANHIEEKGHLINIPSEAEVAENGIQLGEMNARLLEKIEELTLYTIDQDQQLKEQKAINEQLEKSNKELAARLDRLEKLISN